MPTKFIGEWIKEQVDSEVYQVIRDNSVVDRVGKHYDMISDTVRTPVYDQSDPVLTPELEDVPELTTNEGYVLLDAHKFTGKVTRSREGITDTYVDWAKAQKLAFFGNWAAKYDNATLGVATAGNNTDARPYTSVYAATPAGNKTSTAGALTLEHLSGAMAKVETAPRYSGPDTVIVAHRLLREQLRMLKNAAGQFVFEAGQQIAGGTGDRLFGYEVQWSDGARKSTAATSAPTGNPLMVMGPRSGLVVGDRWAPETFIDIINKNHSIEHHFCVRKGFSVVKAERFAVIEVTTA